MRWGSKAGALGSFLSIPLAGRPPRHLDMDRLGNITSRQTHRSPSMGEENQGVTGGQSGILGPCIYGGLQKLGGEHPEFLSPISHHVENSESPTGPRGGSTVAVTIPGWSRERKGEGPFLGNAKALLKYFGGVGVKSDVLTEYRGINIRYENVRKATLSQFYIPKILSRGRCAMNTTQPSKSLTCQSLS